MRTYYKKYSMAYLLLFTCMVGITGCKKDWLEAKPDISLTVPTSLKDLQGLLDDVNVMNQIFPVQGEIASDGYHVTDLVLQNIQANQIYGRDAYIWTKTALHNKINDWDLSYRRILIANIVLEGINKINPINESERTQWNSIKGQALFNRARNFFDLAQTYAPLYNYQSATQDLGIVLRLSSDVAIPSKRSTVQVTYEQILNDLKEAKGLLPARPLYLTRGSASAANALLSRVYLSMGDYANSFQTADDCLKQYAQLLDYNDLLASAPYIGLYNKEVIIHNSYSPGWANTASNLIDQTFYNTYGQNDLRKTRFFRLGTNNVITFKGVYDNTTASWYCGIATDEVYLTRAECHARAGRIAEAMKDLNDLLIKRWDKNVTYVPLTAANADEALTIILRERRKELIFRGVRWMDLRRLNKDPRFAVTLTRTVAGQTYTLEPNSYKYTFPIPDDIIQQTGMQQNPGWE